MNKIKLIKLSLFCFCFSLLPGCYKIDKIDFSSQHQVVFLVNNNEYIGKIQQQGKNFIRLDNVFYIQSQTDQESKKVTITLVKRGNELHKPDFMYINTQHILMIEPVTPNSQVAKLIEQSETENTKQIAPSDTEKK